MILTVYSPLPVLAQLAADQSLGAERSRIERQTERQTDQPERSVINGGAHRGGNLFHSFRDFNVKAGQQVYFANPAGVERILSRVTGENPSRIAGTLGVLGNADLFLLNPNGIIFGRNARLDLRGSFLATTASRLIFDNYSFDTLNPVAPPLLTISTPTGLQMGADAGLIVNRSQADGVGLQAATGQSLSLISPTIRFEAGKVTAPANVELATPVSGTVQLSDSAPFSYADVTSFGEILLKDADIEATGSAKIRLRAGNLMMNGSNLSIETGESARAGAIELTATEAVQMRGSSIRTVANLESASRGAAIEIDSPELTILSGAKIETNTVGRYAAGNIVIRAEDFRLDRTRAELAAGNSAPYITSVTPEAASGDSGTISITANQLAIRDGAYITTVTNGDGNSGTLRIKAENIQVGGGQNGFSYLGTFSGQNAEASNRGNAGRIIIDADRLTLTGEVALGSLTTGFGQAQAVILRIRDRLAVLNGGQVFSTTSGAGNAGTIQIQANELLIQGVQIDQTGLATPGYIYTSSESSYSTSSPEPETYGDAGNIDIQVNRLSLLDGAYIDSGTFTSGNGGSITISAEDILIASARYGNSNLTLGGIYASAQVRQLGNVRLDPGDGGSITITANRLDIRSGGTLSVSGEGRGRAGSLLVNANAITLNQSNLSAQTERGNRGSIRLNATGAVSLRENSAITTNATRQATGGNIQVDSPFLITQDNSDITANAVRGQGGNIAISANRIFDPTSQITATSQLGLDGRVSFSGLDANPSQAVTKLPETPTDASQQIVQRCTGTGIANSNEFIVTGRGGLPAGVQETLSQDEGWWDWRSVAPQARQSSSALQARLPESPIEAQSWRINSQGNVELVGIAQTASQATCGQS